MSLYQRVNIEKALKEHAENIKKIREVCKDDIAKDPEQFNDELFLLRFCLSSKDDTERLITAVKAAVEFRTKNKEILDKIADGKELHPAEKEMGKYFPLAHHKSTKNGSPLFIIRIGIGNMDQCMERMTPQQIEECLIFSKERLYHVCDAESRKRGEVVKMQVIQDFKYFSIFDFNRKFMGILGEASKKMELIYPSLLGCSVVINPPSIMSAMMAVAKLVMPATVFSKFKICGGASTRTGEIKTCPVGPALFNLDDLPTFCGGKCECKEHGGCICGVPNNQKEKINVPEEKKK